MRNDTSRILLAHGSGGRLTHELVATLFRPAFSNPALDALDDAAVLAADKKKYASLAFTTDSFVVNPLFFPGGDIGKIAVCGTVNDLSMKGARPLGISIAAIIEEGFEVDRLRKIIRSIAAACREAGVAIVTGDTKVVEKGKADGLFLTTSGVGGIPAGVLAGPA
jgi:hydrogenase expression/formation protein HypE